MAGALVYLVVMFFIVFSIIRSAKKNGYMANKTGQPGAVPAAKANARPRGYTNFRPHKDIVSVSRDMSDRNSAVLKDDRDNDWLARQLREEHRAFKLTSEMFDLKIEHASHCDARLLEQFHRHNCTADGIDLANGNTLYMK